MPKNLTPKIKAMLPANAMVRVVNNASRRVRSGEPTKKPGAGAPGLLPRYEPPEGPVLEPIGRRPSKPRSGSAVRKVGLPIPGRSKATRLRGGGPRKANLPQ